MKQIFNWMHRKFHFNVESNPSFSPMKDEVEQNAKKSETVTNESETNALLSIGTFGFDPLELYNNLNGDFVEHKEDKEDVVDEEEGEEEKEELNPLVIKVFKGELEKVLCSSSASSAMNPDLKTIIDDEIDTPLLRFLESVELQEDSTLEEKKKKKGERTTLADLFSAESDTTAAAPVNSESSIVHQPGRLEKTKCQKKKHGLSFAKKFLTRKGDDDSLPITKLHRLIKKMLKKKIHPELQGKVHGMNALLNTPKSDEGEGDPELNESLSLLQGCEMDIADSCLKQ